MPEDQVIESGERKIIRRAPAVQVQVKDIKENFGRVSFIGTVINKNPEINSMIIDDENSRVLVLTNDQYAFDAVKEGQLVRVFGKVMGTGDEIEILADFIQDFSKIDRELYKKVFYK